MTTTTSIPLSLDGSPTDHDVLDVLATIRTAIAAARSVPLDAIDADHCRSALLEITAAGNQLAELELELLHRGEALDVGRLGGAPSTATWLAMSTGRSTKSVHARARLANAVARHPSVGAAMARGDLLTDQAEAIAETLDRLPDDHDKEAAASWLVRRAARDTAGQLRVQGRDMVSEADRARDVTAAAQPTAGGADRDDEADPVRQEPTEPRPSERRPAEDPSRPAPPAAPAPPTPQVCTDRTSERVVLAGDPPEDSAGGGAVDAVLRSGLLTRALHRVQVVLVPRTDRRAWIDLATHVVRVGAAALGRRGRAFLRDRRHPGGHAT